MKAFSRQEIQAEFFGKKIKLKVLPRNSFYMVMRRIRIFKSCKPCSHEVPGISMQNSSSAGIVLYLSMICSRSCCNRSSYLHVVLRELQVLLISHLIINAL